MTRTIPLIALSAALALAGCSKTADEPDVAASTAAADEAVEPAAAPEPTESEAASEPIPTPTPTPSASETVAATEIPAAIRGRWGLVPKDCTTTLGDAKGLLTVSAGQLKFYESVAKLGKIAEADDSRIKAKFTYSGEGMTWVHDVVLDVQDGGKTLVRRDYGPDAGPRPLKYTRCS